MRGGINRCPASALQDVLCKHRIMHEIVSTDRRMRWGGTLLCAICLAYFYALDRVLFSSAHFSPIFRHLLTVYDVRSAWLAAAVCFFAALWNRPAPIVKWVEFVGRHPHSIALTSAAIYGIGTILCPRFSLCSPDQTPQCQQ